ncbi:MAG: hypothetical protein WBQ94_17765 [Terracidiphilus sp.]
MNLALVKTTYWWNKMLGAMTGSSSFASGPLAASKIGLGTAIITPGAATTYAQLTEATFVGYLESAAIVWTSLTNELDGSQSAYAPSHLFLCTGASTTPAVANAFVTDGVGTASVGNASTGIFGSVKIAPTINIQNPGDGLMALVQWNEGVVSLNSNIDVQS